MGMLGERRAQEIERQTAGRALYLEMGFGALLANQPPGPAGILTCTQGWWTSAYALGRWAGAPGRRACVVATLFDAGYDGLYAFRLGFEESGGSIVSTEVLDVPGRERLPAAVLDGLESYAPDVVYASLHDHQGQLFLRAWAERSGLSGCELLASPQLAGVPSLGAAPDVTLHCAATYDPALAFPANADFLERFRSRQGVLPDGTAVAGWEAGRLLQAVAGCAASPEVLREAIRSRPCSNPRADP